MKAPHVARGVQLLLPRPTLSPLRHLRVVARDLRSMIDLGDRGSVVVCDRGAIMGQSKVRRALRVSTKCV